MTDIVFADHKSIAKKAHQILIPPEIKTVSEYANENIYIHVPNKFFGKFDSNRTPLLAQIADYITDPRVNKIAVVAPAQSSKTQNLTTNGAFHSVCSDKMDAMIVQPTKDTARDFSSRVADRTIHASPNIKAMLRGKQYDNVHDKQFVGGGILSLAWATKGWLSGKSVGRIFFPDYDRNEDDIDGEGSAFGLGENRIKTFHSKGLVLAESSPSKPIEEVEDKEIHKHAAPPSKGILGLYNEGTMHRVYNHCYHCDDFFMPTFGIDAVWLPEIDTTDRMEIAQQAGLICTNCGCVITQDHEQEFRNSGIWVGANQTIVNGEAVGEIHDNFYTFWMHGWHAYFQSWQSIIKKYLDAKHNFDQTGDEERLKQVVNTDMSGPYLYEAQKRTGLEPEHLIERKENYERRVVPYGVRYIIATVDVQGNRFVVQVMGYGANDESWLIDRFNIKYSDRLDDYNKQKLVKPHTYAEDWDLLTEDVLRRTYPLVDDSGRTMAIVAMGVDSGGLKDKKTGTTVTGHAYAYYRRLIKTEEHKKLALIKGRPTGDKVQIRYPDAAANKRNTSKMKSKGDIPVHFLNVNALKDIVYNNMNREEEGTGFMHFPHWLKAFFFNELCAEIRKPSGWLNPTGRRNESFDLYTYAEGIKLAIGVSKIDWLKPPSWADEWDNNINVSEVETKYEEKKKSLAEIMKELNG